MGLEHSLDDSGGLGCAATLYERNQESHLSARLSLAWLSHPSCQLPSWVLIPAPRFSRCFSVQGHSLSRVGLAMSEDIWSPQWGRGAAGM